MADNFTPVEEPTFSEVPPGTFVDTDALSTMDMLGTQKPSVATHPLFKVEIADVDWTESFLFGNSNLDGTNNNGSFNLQFDLRIAGKMDENDAITEGSPLDTISKLRKEPHRDIVKLSCGYDSVADHLFFSGLLDKIEVNFQQSLVTLTGRDRSALLQEGFTHLQTRNATVMDLLKIVADKYQLQLDVVDPKQTIGEVFEDEQFGMENSPSSGYNDWDLLTKLADRLAYAVYVENNTLVFKPYQEGTDIIEFALGTNIIDLTLHKNFNTAQARICVEFVGVDQQGKKSVLVSVGSKSETPGETAVYRFPVAPNTPIDSLQRTAQSLVTLAAQTEYAVSIDTVGHPKQTLQKKMRLSGTQTAFDRDYRIASIAWQFGFEHGWTATIEGFSIPEGIQAISGPAPKVSKRKGAGTAGTIKGLPAEPTQ